MARSDALVVSGAREHNLKDVTLAMPRDALVVITGLSGSGKSSLAFDTIYAEGQRRYVESLSAYARQFLGQMDKPDVDSIEGLSPAISIDQKTTSRNPRSTVGTVTEIYDYLRLLWARIGQPHCHICGKPIAGQSADSIETAVALADGMVEVETVPREGEGEPERRLYSECFACPDHGPSIPELEPRIFSFNSPHGACERCTGLGSQMEIDPDLVVPDPTLTIGEGALLPWANSASGYYEQITQGIADTFGVDLECPWEALPEEHQALFLHGTGGERIHVSYRNRYGRKRSYATNFEGIIPNP